MLWHLALASLGVMADIFSPTPFPKTEKQVRELNQKAWEIHDDIASEPDTNKEIERFYDSAVGNDIRNLISAAKYTEDQGRPLSDLRLVTKDMLATMEHAYEECFVKTRLEELMGTREESWEEAMNDYTEKVVAHLDLMSSQVRPSAGQMDRRCTPEELARLHAPARARLMLSSWPRRIRHLPLPTTFMVEMMFQEVSRYSDALKEVRPQIAIRRWPTC